MTTDMRSSVHSTSTGTARSVEQSTPGIGLDEQEATWPSRLYGLEISRGVASLAVVLWHWQNLAFEDDALAEWFARANQPFYQFLKVFYEAGRFGVQYFFVLSGFIFFWLYSREIQIGAMSPQRFAILRFSRLYPLHIVTLLLVLLLQWVHLGHEGSYFAYEYNDLRHFVLNLFLLLQVGLQKGWSFNAPAWTVSVEMLLYFAFFVVSAKGLQTLRSTAAFCLGSYLVSLLYRHSIIYGASLFFLGGLTYHVSVMATRQAWARCLFYLVAIVGWTLVLVYFYLPETRLSSGLAQLPQRMLSDAAAVFVFPATIASLALLEAKKVIRLRKLAWVGDTTYSTYLIHFPLQLLMVVVFSGEVSKRELVTNPVALCLYLGVLVIFAMCVYRWFELPVKDLLRKRFAS